MSINEGLQYTDAPLDFKMARAATVEAAAGILRTTGL